MPADGPGARLPASRATLERLRGDSASALGHLVNDGLLPTTHREMKEIVRQCIELGDLDLLSKVWSLTRPSKLKFSDVELTIEVIEKFSGTLLESPKWKPEELVLDACRIQSGALLALLQGLNRFTHWGDGSEAAIALRILECEIDDPDEFNASMSLLENNSSIAALVASYIEGIDESLGQAIARNPAQRLRELTLEECALISEESAVALCRALGRGVVTVSLIGVEGLDLRQLPLTSEVQELVIEGCEINSDEKINAVARFVKGSPLKRLVLERNSMRYLTDRLVESIAGKRTLQILGLRDNALAGEPVKRLVRELLARGKIEALNLSWNSIGDEVAQEIGECLSGNTSLTHLLLDGCHVGNQGCDLILKGIGKASAVKVLSLEDNDISDLPIEALEENRSLEVLALDGNSLSDLSLLNMPDNGVISVLRLSECEIDCNGLEILLEGNKFQGLEQIYLSSNRIGDDGLKLLMNWGKFASLKRVHLDDTGLSRDGILSFLDSLKHRPVVIEELALWQPWFVEDSKFVAELVERLIDLLSVNETLMRLDHPSWSTARLARLQEIDTLLAANQGRIDRRVDVRFEQVLDRFEPGGIGLRIWELMKESGITSAIRAASRLGRTSRWMNSRTGSAPWPGFIATHLQPIAAEVERRRTRTDGVDQ